jgi:hypothetical protein
MKHEDIQPGRRYYVKYSGDEEGKPTGECFVASVIVVVEGEVIARTSDDGAVWRLEAEDFLAPVPDNWLQRLLRR